MIKLLLEYQADLNIFGSKDYTLLMNASNKGSVEIVKLLLKYGANVNTQNINKITALMIALMYASKKGYVNIVKNMKQNQVYRIIVEYQL